VTATLPRVQPEDGPAYTFEMTTSLAGLWTVISTLILIAAMVAIAAVYGVLGRAPISRATNLLLFPVALLVTLPLHELVHAAFVVLFGGRPRFGAGIKGAMPYLYVTDPGRRFNRNRFIVIALAPLVLIDGVALALILIQPSWSWAAVAFVVNTSGAIGDLWVVGLLVRFPPWALVEDRTLGFAVWSPRGRNRTQVNAAAPRKRVPAPGWLSAWLFSAFVIYAALPVTLLVLAGRLAGGRGAYALAVGPLSLVHVYARSSGGPEIELNLLSIGVVAALLAVPVTVLWQRLRRRLKAR
jgi:putative zincin peptidase